MLDNYNWKKEFHNYCKDSSFILAQITCYKYTWQQDSDYMLCTCILIMCIIIQCYFKVAMYRAVGDWGSAQGGMCVTNTVESPALPMLVIILIQTILVSNNAINGSISLFMFLFVYTWIQYLV